MQSPARPAWLQNRAIPRLIVTLRYDGQDAFGAARALQRLDLAARRAGAMQRRLMVSEVDKSWPQPLRTYQGGLHVLDARVGSVDILMTVRGALVTIAGSAPISVASLMALAWDVGRGAVHVTKRWQGAVMARPQRDPMVHERVEAAQDWASRTRRLSLRCSRRRSRTIKVLSFRSQMALSSSSSLCFLKNLATDSPGYQLSLRSGAGWVAAAEMWAEELRDRLAAGEDTSVVVKEFNRLSMPTRGSSPTRRCPQTDPQAPPKPLRPRLARARGR